MAMTKTEYKINGGAISWARQTIESEIFKNKPDKWFKIWFYLVSKAKWKETKQFHRGQCFMKYEWIREITGASQDQVKHCIGFLKDTSMITTEKLIRGFILSITNYDIYQNLENYKGKKEGKKKLTSIQIVVEHYKKVKKYDTIPNWDKEHFARATASAKRILSQADDEAQACDAITKIGKYHDNEGLSWTIETIVKKYPDWKLGKLGPKARKSQPSKLHKDLDRIAKFGEEK